MAAPDWQRLLNPLSTIMTQEKTTKKLSIRSMPKADEGSKPRVRTGARARHVALQERQQQVQESAANARKQTSRAKPTRPRHTFSDKHDRYDPSHKNTRTFSPPTCHPSYHDDIFPVFAPCPIGLEKVLTDELNNLGLQNVRQGRSGCSFMANWSGIMKANLYSRLATRILVQVAHAKVTHEDDIYDLTKQVPWERWFGAEKTLRVDTSAIRSPMQSLQFCNLRVKDGVVDHLRDIEGKRPSIDTVRPDAKVHLFLDSESATLYLDTSGESLFKRGWRYDKGLAPLRENLAAGLLALAGWTPNYPLYDPFCGSGTILIEAAWIALGIPPGLYRPFAFERLRDVDRTTWTQLKEEARNHISPSLATPLFGADIDSKVIQAARANLRRAKLPENSLHFSVGNVLQSSPPTDTAGFLIANPPYGERLEEEEESFWREWSRVLKNNFANWKVHVITNDMAFPKKLRLKPNSRTPIFNGDIECRLFGFDMVSDSYRQK